MSDNATAGRCNKCADYECTACILCEKRLCAEKSVVVTKGLAKIVEISLLVNDNLHESLDGKTAVQVHVTCRKNYTRRVKKAVQPAAGPSRSLRSAEVGFCFKKSCVLCAKEVTEDSKHPDRHDVHVISSMEIKGTITKQAEERKDEWGDEVTARVNGVVSDLVAAEARYHGDCLRRFLKPGFLKPGAEPSGKANKRQTNAIDTSKYAAFQRLCEYLEQNEGGQHELRDLIKRMEEFSSTGECYGEKHTKNLLEKRYGAAILISYSQGKAGLVVTFKRWAHRILSGKWHSDKSADLEQESKRIVETAAELIREQCWSRGFESDHFPSTENIECSGNDSIPELLALFLNKLMKSKTKRNAPSRRRVTVAHALLASMQPGNFQSPLHLALGVSLHRKTGTRYWIDMLFRLGLCSSYDEVLKFEACVTMHAPPVVSKGGMLHFVFDNADHNARTLDGRCTIHVVGGIMIVTPFCKLEAKAPVPRPKVMPTAAEVGDKGVVPVVPFVGSQKAGLAKHTMKDVITEPLESPGVVKSKNLNTLWMSGPSVGAPSCPGWSGFMEEALQSTEKTEISAIVPLPFVNLSPSDPSAIYTALLHARKKCDEYGQRTCIVTFDQPLYIKAMDVVHGSGSNSPLVFTILRLGGFHLLMSFMGAVGYLMGGSGLAELWAQVYAKNSVSAMLGGHAYSRALRAHFLTLLSLATIIFDDGIQSGEISEETVKNLKKCHLKKTNGALDNAFLNEFRLYLENKFRSESEKSRTAQLWVQYCQLVEIMQQFVFAERTRDWGLHLSCVQRMLPFLAAAGHIHYAKAGHLYLQEMAKLEQTLTMDEFEKFVEQGWFTVFRKECKPFSGTWTDMIIEQTLMRAMKTQGGLTHGRGMALATVSRWVNSAPHVTHVIESLEEFCGVTQKCSYQHIEIGATRQRRDETHVRVFVEYFRQHYPFRRSTGELVNISTGLVADESVNCDKAEEIGRSISLAIVGKCFTDVTIPRKKKAVNIGATNNTIQIGGEKIPVNPSTVFHRIICNVRTEEKLEECMGYELAPQPTALFDGITIRTGTKSQLIKVFEKVCKPDSEVPAGAIYVIDGGSLLWRLKWPRPATYDTIAELHVKYLLQKYGVGTTIVVVFDGYNNGPSTKDVQHLKRASVSATVSVSAEKTCITTREEFLGNSENKAQLIPIVANKLRAAGIQVIETSGDADVAIVNAALEKAAVSSNVVLVGEDTDLLVLLLVHASPETDVKMLMLGRNKNSKRVFSSKKLQEKLGPLLQHLLFLHAVTGCDTTSTPFRRAKHMGFQKLQKLLQNKSPILEKIAAFNNKNSSPEEIAAAGEAFLVALYGGRRAHGLNRTRYLQYKRMVARHKITAKFEIARLPPTSSAARQHSFRVFHQVQAWRGVHLPETDWGWREERGMFVPVTSSLPVAPEYLLSLIFCNCKSTCGVNCECKRAGLECTSMCGHCAGDSCGNSPGPIHEGDMEAEEEQEEADDPDPVDFVRFLDNDEGESTPEQPDRVPDTRLAVSSSTIVEIEHQENLEPPEPPCPSDQFRPGVNREARRTRAGLRSALRSTENTRSAT